MSEQVYILRERYPGDLTVYASGVRWDKITDHIGKATTFATAKMAAAASCRLADNWQIWPIDKKEIFLAKLKA